MKTLKVVKILVILLILAAVFPGKTTYAQEECDANGFIAGTWCPCPPDPALASVCGLVSSAKLDVTTTTRGRDGGEFHPWMTREAVGGVTVSIYENNPRYSSGKPFGRLDSKLLECVTTPPPEGKYHCLMRRLNPGNVVYVIFSCEGKIADIKIIPSVRNITVLDADIDCSGQYEYVALPGVPNSEDEVLDIAERENILGCMSTYEDEVNPNAGFEQPEHDFFSTIVGEEGGDLRFNEATYLSVIEHPGALWEKDCLFEYSDGGADDLRREYATIPILGSLRGLFGESDYGSPEEKCNFDPDRDGDGAIDGQGGDPLDDPDELTVPFRYDIPTLQLEHEQVKVWENRVSLQREMQDPRAFAQYNHLMFGDCVQEVSLRFYGDLEEDQPIPCDALIRCGQTVGSPRRNIHTSMSFGARLENPATFGEVIANEERDNQDVVCWHPDHGDVAIAQIQPHNPPDPCMPGSSGCQYLLPSTYYFPQFMIQTGGVKKPRTSETIGDTYGGVVRSTSWEAVSTEANQGLHVAGHYGNFEDATAHKNNSGMTAVRLANEDEGATDGVMVNRFVSFGDALVGRYDYNASAVIWDMGGDVKSLCSMSAINDDFIIPNPLEELLTMINNRFRGASVDHDPRDQDPDYDGDETGGTATYATAWGVARDEWLREEGRYYFREVWDSMQRFASGDGRLDQSNLATFWRAFWATAWGRLFSVGEDQPNKSFADRNPEDAPWAFSNNAYMNAQYCLGEDSFEGTFPPYGDGGYPGSHACYPWRPVASGEYCNSWPGPPSRWSTLSGSTKTDLGYDENNWPGIIGELRTCRVVDCHAMWKVRTCTEEICTWIWDPVDLVWFYDCRCGDGNFDGEVESRVRPADGECTDTEYERCLIEQLDTWDRWVVWQRGDHSAAPNPGPLQPPRYRDRAGDRVTACDLDRAGFMTEPGDIWKDFMARIIQQPFLDESQKNLERVSQSTNYTFMALHGPVNTERDYEWNKGGMTDAATSNDINSGGSGGDYSTANQLEGGGFAVVHRELAGANTEGFGTGATTSLLKVISHPTRPGVMSMPFPPIREACNVYDRDPNNWCRLIPVPGPIDLDSFGDSGCEPNVSGGSCPVPGSIGNLAQRILGSAGAKFNVPGSLLLAVIEGEGGWLSGNRMRWDDDSIASYSEPWSARIPECNDMVAGAQGPFGLIDVWYKQAVWGCDYGDCWNVRAGDPSLLPVDIGGYHASRVNSEGGVVSSKCNFIDAAYAAAKMLSFPGSSCGMGEADIRRALAVYRGGSNADPADVPNNLVQIARYCR